MFENKEAPLSKYEKYIDSFYQGYTDFFYWYDIAPVRQITRVDPWLKESKRVDSKTKIIVVVYLKFVHQMNKLFEQPDLR